MKDITTIDPIRDANDLYQIMDELCIHYKKTTCSKCLKDYYNICLEELGLIDDASELSDFNGYKYLKDRTVIWNGHKMNQHTDPEIIEEFIKDHHGYYATSSETAAKASI